MRPGLLLLILPALAALPGCDNVPKPPRPTLAGPDSSWTNIPTAFTVAFSHDSGDWMTLADFDWGDSCMTYSVYNLDDQQTHVYAEPGMHAAKCRLWNMHPDVFGSERVYGGWSKPCTVDIVSGDSRTLRGRTRD